MALQTIGLVEPPDAKILWIRNTLHLAEVECSAAYWDDARQRDDLEIVTDPRELQFDARGDLIPFESALADALDDPWQHYAGHSGRPESLAEIARPRFARFFSLFGGPAASLLDPLVDKRNYETRGFE